MTSTNRLELHAWLTSQGQLDTAAWEAGRMPWLTCRQRLNLPRRDGELVKLEEGWAIRNLDRDDDPLLAFGASLIRPGDLATVTRLDGEELVYRIVAVEAG